MSDIPPGLENLHYTFAGQRPAGAFSPVLVGVVGCDRTTRAAPGHEKDVGKISVAADMGADDSVGAAAMLQNRSAGAVSEQHTGIAIGPVRDRAEFFRTDDQHGLVGMGRNELLADLDSE